MKSNLLWGKEIVAQVWRQLCSSLLHNCSRVDGLDGWRRTMSTPTTALVHLEQRTTDRAFAATGCISDAQAQIAGLRRDVNVSTFCDGDAAKYLLTKEFDWWT